MRSSVHSADDERFMRRAIELAERGLGETNPNPMVGCVLVRAGQAVGEGFHARAGSAHAEEIALTRAGERAKGATAYVTLEPCAPNEAKRRPPCAPRLAEAGVTRVVFGVRDGNPRVRGAGARILRSAGIEVVAGVCSRESARLAHHFNAAMMKQRPFIALKAGVTLDGRIATARGESKWITSFAQRKEARRLRRLFDGVLIGLETARQDDPLLLPEPRTRRPMTRVVLDSRLRLPLTSRLVKTARRDPLMVVCVSPSAAKRRALEERGATVVVVDDEEGGRVKLPSALDALFARGITSLLVEGGSEIMGSFVRGRLFDEFVLFRAPLILGGRGSLSVVGGANPRALADAVPMRRAAFQDSATLHYGLQQSVGLAVEVYERRANRSSAGTKK